MANWAILNFAITLLLLSSSVALAAVSPPDTKPAPFGEARSKSSTQQTVIEEIIVTANKRRESHRIVPSSVSVMTDDSLDQIGAKSFQDFAAYMPGISSSSSGEGFNRIVIRGVTSGSEASPTTAVYIDESPVGSSSAHAFGYGAIDFSTFDLQRIELLSGPQGTLYGASSLGGLLKYVTKEPDPNELTVKAQYEESSVAHGEHSRTIQGVLNLPLSEEIAGFRLAVFDRDSSGYINKPEINAENVNAAKSEGVRASLLVDPASAMRIKLMSLDQKITRGSFSTSDRDASTSEPKNGDLDDSAKLDEPFESVLRMHAVTFTWDFEDITLWRWSLGDITLLSNTSVQDQKTRFDQDITDLFGAVLGTGDTIPFLFESFTEIDKKVQEIRLTSSSNGRFDWMLGGVYISESSVLGFFVDDKEPRLDGATAFAGGPVALLAPLPPLTISGLSGVETFRGVLFNDYEESGIYGNITYRLTDKLDITAGVRKAKITQDFTQIFSGLLGNPRDPTNPLVDMVESKDIVETYLLNPRYRFDDDIMLYFRAANGFRPGGANFVNRSTTTNEPVGEPTFKPDSLWNYEIGVKSGFFDNRIKADASLYTIRWDDIQLVANREGVNNLENAGAAEIDGAEITLQFLPTSWLTVTGSFAWTDAELVEEAVNIEAREGSRLPLSPKFNSSLILDGRLGLPGFLSGLTLSFGISYTYTGARKSGFDGSSVIPQYDLPAYDVYGARLSLLSRFADVTLFAQNVFDERGQISTDIVSLTATAENPELPVRTTIIQPRTIGASITVTY